MPNSLWGKIVLTDWLQRVTAILTGLFLYQFVLWIEKEEVIWLPETTAFVIGTLSIAVISYFIPHLQRGWRYVIQFLLIIWLHGLGMNYHLSK
ncbi:hypothetical protein [Paenibacillus sp. N3.4]|uniref:hypothetical protein n=1 Tax=Paenibacillus sp. N3.4 TaxID=2603222 RepID=UPI0011C821F3|nr:hypothetical protein [Paenibacillus sp. N3.4]TXK84055.1 hypothetical protein FU659_10420 [Paenibacillus sp. N3.4]